MIFFSLFLSFLNWKKTKSERMIKNLWVRAIILKKKCYGYDRWHKTWNSRAQNENKLQETKSSRCDSLHWMWLKVNIAHTHQINLIPFFIYNKQFGNEGIAYVFRAYVQYYLLYHFSFPLLQCHRAIQAKEKKKRKNEKRNLLEWDPYTALKRGKM